MNLRKLAAIALATCAVTTCLCIVPSSAAGSANAQKQSIEEQIAANAQKQKELEAQLSALSSSLDDAWEKKTTLDAAVEVTAQQKYALQTLIEQLEADITELSKLDQETSQSIKEQRQAFLNRMAALHEDGNASYLELVLGAEDLGTFLTKFDYVNSMLEYDKKVIADLKESKKILAQTREEKEKDLAQQKTAQEQLLLQESQLNALVAEQQAVIDQIYADKSTTEALKNQAEADEAQLDAQLTEILLEIQRQEELAKQEAEKNQQNNSPDAPPPYISADGEYMWPLPGAVISSSFGGRYLNGVYEYHPATDIAADTGTPIYCANEGTVIISEYHYSYGNYVVVNHGNGYATLYAHMSVRGVSAGQVVSKGTVLGQVGNTGYSFGSHLHFEFRINGERMDAEQYINPY